VSAVSRDAFGIIFTSLNFGLNFIKNQASTMNGGAVSLFIAPNESILHANFPD
jgi:predicted outer membrane repeat protein